jgi:nucleotide-binding universal stress UspA family protein
MFTMILVPLDGSRLSTKAIHYAIDIASKFDAEVTLLQVVKPANPIVGGGPAEIGGPAVIDIEMRVAIQQDAKNMSGARIYLQRQIRKLRERGIKSSYKVILGSPANSIAAFCHQNNIDLIIMTTHGKSGFKRAVLGSVSDEVVRQSGVPVLLIKVR